MSVDYRPDYDPADVDSDYGHTGGNITVPTFTGDTRPFRFWCQKALPLVYDDSLSYYEVLCKMADYMNNFVTDLTTVEDSMTEFGQQFVINQQFLNSMADQLGQNVADLEAYINNRMDDFMTAYTQLQTYVNNYFDNLDVQEEINAKLDEMASDGTLNNLFDPVLETWMQQKTAQIDAAIAGQDAIQAAQNARISVLEGRMDTFSGLPSGSTSGNAELLDIRTNFLGETYPTAGDAVRASDMIASGFLSIPFTRLEKWNGNESSNNYDTIQFDVSAYKGGHVVMIANMDDFILTAESVGIGVFATNVSGKTADQNAHAYALTSTVFPYYSEIQTQISGEERIALFFSIPEDFSYQYLKMGYVQEIPNGDYTQPAAIVYANSWSKTQVDPTLTIAGAAADAKAAGDAIDELNERFYNEIDNIEHFMYPFITNECEIGYINRTTGADDDTSEAQDYYIRSVGLQYNRDQLKIMVGSDYAVYVYYYNSDGTYITSSNAISNAEITINADSFVRVCVRYNPAVKITEKDIFVLQHKFIREYDLIDDDIDFNSMIDITDSNWTADTNNYLINGYLPLDLSQDYFIYVPKMAKVIIKLASDGASTGTIGPFVKSQIIPFTGVAEGVFTKFAVRVLFYGNTPTGNAGYPKLFKVGVNKEIKTLTFDMTKLGHVDCTNGTITESSDTYWGLTDYLTIPHNTKTILSNMRYRSDIPAIGYAIYDENKTFLRGGQEDHISIKNTDRYIVLCDGYTIPNVGSTHLNRTVCFVGNASPFCDKIVAFSGDSITFGYNDLYNGKQLDNTWVNQVGNNIGVKQIINYGVSSASLMEVDGTPWAIIDAYEDYSNDIDIVGFMIGINDAYRGYTFGTVNDTTESTFLGCMNVLCSGIVSKWKPADNKFAFIMLYPQTDQTQVDRQDVQYKGLTGWDAWNEAVKDVAGKHGLPVCDLYHNVGITPAEDPTNIYWGGTSSRHSSHPTQVGADVIAKYVSNWVKRTFELQ